MTASQLHGRSKLAGVAALVLVLVLGLTLAACGSDDDGSGDAGAAAGGSGEELTIGASYPSFGPFYAVMYSLTKEEVARQGTGELLEAANANYDAARQITDMRNLITAGATGLLIAAGDPNVIPPGLEYAKGEGVPVVALDVAPGSGEVYMVVRSDNQFMGRAACEEIGSRVDGDGKVLQLQGDLTSINAQDRTEGFETCMAEKFPDIEIISRETKWKADVSANHAETVLNANPDLDGIFMQSDAIDLLGVLRVLERTGRDAPVGQPEHVVVVGIDGTAQALDAVRADQVDAIVSQPVDLYAKYGLQYLEDAVAGVEHAPGPTDHESEIITTTGGNLEDQLRSPVVTAENVDDPSLWGNARGADAEE